MKHYCHYHPVSPAKWHCPSCNRYFDSACVPDGDERRRVAKCPHCNKAMDYFREPLVDQPFWEASERYLKLPLRPEVMLVWLFLSLAAVLVPSNLLVALVYLMALSCVCAFAAQGILTRIASSPKKSIAIKDVFNVDILNKSIPVGLFLFSLCLVNYYVFTLFGWILGGLIGIFSVMTLPAILLAMATRKTLSEAFTPEAMSAPLFQMGAAYFGLLAYFILAIFTTLIAADFAHLHFYTWLYWPTFVLVAAYFVLSLFGMMGHVIAQYHHFEGERSRESSAPRFVGEDTKRLDAKLDMALKKGKYSKALDYLEADLKRDPRSEFRRTQFIKLALATNDLTRLEQHVHANLKMLVMRNQLAYISDIIDKLRANNPEFKLYDLPLCLELAGAFHKRKRDDMVVWLAEDAHTRFELDEKLAELYLVAAKALVAKLKHANKARQFLRFILQNFPDHETAKAAKILHAHVAKYSAS